MAKIFITGINGFIGSNLAILLKNSGHDIFGTSRSVRGDAGVFSCDLRKYSEISKLIATIDPDVIVHAAALSSVTSGEPIDYYETNVIGTENVLNSVSMLNHGVRFLYISTAGVYGNQGIPVLNENLAPKPVSHYAISKYAGECLVLGEFSRFNDVTVVRPFNIVGSGQKNGFIFPKIVSHFRQREPIIRLGNLDPVRDYLDIDSCCGYLSQIIFSAESYNQVVNLCSGVGTSVRQLIDILTEITGHRINVSIDPEFVRANEVWSLLGDTKKLRNICSDPIVSRSIEDVLKVMLKT